MTKYTVVEKDREDIARGTLHKGDQYTLDEHGRFHSFNDQPAVIYNTGERFWLNHGVDHRDCGPASILSDGSMHWFLNNKSTTPLHGLTNMRDKGYDITEYLFCEDEHTRAAARQLLNDTQNTK